jgi:hypothetical protein
MTEIDPQWQADYITANTRKAQVHAILALAAATALHGVTDHQHWFEVAGAGHAHG